MSDVDTAPEDEAPRDAVLAGDADSSQPVYISLVVVIVSLALATLVLLLGANEISQIDNARRLKPPASLDGRLTVADIESARDATGGVAGEPAARSCDTAIENYERYRNRAISDRAPFEMQVPGALGSSAEAPTCVVIDESRSPQAGLSVLITAAMAAVCVPIAAVAATVALRRGLGRRLWFVAGSQGLVLAALSWLTAGEYRNESQLLVALGAVFVATTPAFALLLDASVRSQVQGTSPEELLLAVRRLRYETRVVILSLSVLLSLSVALAASLNGRFLSASGVLTLEPLDGLSIGGFREEHVGTVTAVEGLLFAFILVVVVAPAIVNTERLGVAVLKHDRREDRDQALDDLVEREETAAKLGIATRPLQWIENGIALLLPLATGVGAEVLGLLG